MRSRIVLRALLGPRKPLLRTFMEVPDRPHRWTVAGAAAEAQAKVTSPFRIPHPRAAASAEFAPCVLGAP
eukprot:scaffold109_cov252-Pinguiococcus_pyrenoidosus.AAC.43